MATITKRVPKQPKPHDYCGAYSCHLCFELVDITEIDTRATDEEMHEWLTEELAKDETAKEIDPIVTDRSQDFIHMLLGSVPAEHHVARERTR